MLFSSSKARTGSKVTYCAESEGVCRGVKKIVRSATLLAASAFVATGALTMPANAASHEAPAFLGHPKAWGVVTFKITRGATAPRTTVNAGGGTWTYGSGVDNTTGLKYCFSDYENSSSYHSATSVLGSSKNKVYANAGYYADSNVTGSYSDTCQTYWATY